MENDTKGKRVCRGSLYCLGYIFVAGLLIGVLILLPMYTESLGIMGEMGISRWWHLALMQLGCIGGIALLAVASYFIYHWAWGDSVKEGKGK